MALQLANAPPLLPPTDRPQWDGSPLRDGTLLLIADQGYGDVIQFARYIPWAAARCAEVAIACSAELHPVIEQLAGAGAVVRSLGAGARVRRVLPAVRPAAAGRHAPRYDPGRRSPICGPIPARSAVWAERLARLLPRGYRRIGIVWAGRPTHHNDRNRSTTLATFAPFADMPGIAAGVAAEGPSRRRRSAPIGAARRWSISGRRCGDFADTMAILDCLDLVVTVDTSVGHLAGAMGKPAWIMLPYAPDWRWLLDRADSPWYPTVRLFRQGPDRSWDAVIASIAKEVAAASRPPGPR